MRSCCIRILLLILGASCESDNLDPASHNGSIRLAGFYCGKSTAEMQWYSQLLDDMEKNVGLRGDIYVATIDGNVVLIHQPIVMSCLACVLYDCEGNKIDMATMDHEKLRLEMTFENRVFRAF